MEPCKHPDNLRIKMRGFLPTLPPKHKKPRHDQTECYVGTAPHPENPAYREAEARLTAFISLVLAAVHWAKTGRPPG